MRDMATETEGDIQKNQETKNFIQEIVEGDIQSGKHGGRVHTRFPP